MNNFDSHDVAEGRILNILGKNGTQNIRKLVADVEYTSNCRNRYVAVESWISYYITRFDGNCNYKT